MYVCMSGMYACNACMRVCACMHVCMQWAYALSRVTYGFVCECIVCMHVCMYVLDVLYVVVCLMFVWCVCNACMCVQCVYVCAHAMHACMHAGVYVV